MQWLDVAGVPGAGKSTIVKVWWPDRHMSHKGARIPEGWASFIDVAEELLAEIPNQAQRETRTRLCRRGFLRAAAAATDDRPNVYIQTGLVQRGFSICARINDASAVERYYNAMPVSVGVVMITLPEAEATKRNIERGADRSKLIRPVARIQAAATRVLLARCVPVLELDGTQPVKVNRARIVKFVSEAGYATPVPFNAGKEKRPA